MATKMKRRIFLQVAALSVLFLALLFPCPSYAGDATVYKITIKEIKLLKSDGVTWVTIASPNQEVDVASVNAGATAGSFLAGIKIPEGDYINFEVVVSETMKYAGSDAGHNVTQGGLLTITGDDATDGQSDTWATDPPGAASNEYAETCDGTAGESTITVDLENGGDADDYFEVRRGTNLTTPISVKSDSEFSISFDFDTQGCIHYQHIGPAFPLPGANDVMFLTPLGNGTKTEITVDGVTTTFAETDMVLYM